MTMFHTPTPLPQGRIDIHSHMIPGIDDGCRDINESLTCVRMLQSRGYVGTICTPHMATTDYPGVCPNHVAVWADNLQKQITQAGLTYRIWTGGELRIFPDCVAWMEHHGIPTLANSRCVLMDFWELSWSPWVERTFRWLLDHHYQPVLAHPERLPSSPDLDTKLKRLEEMGVWFQGNFRCITGDEGPAAQAMFRYLLSHHRYRFLAMDMHKPNTLDSRLAGLGMVEELIGKSATDQLIANAPRTILMLT